MSTDARESELVRRAAGGDVAALMTLLTESRQRLCAHVQKRIPQDLRPALDAEDLVQQTHIEVFRHITTFEARTPYSFARWVSTIALRKLRDAIRAKRADKRGGGKLDVGMVPRARGVFPTGSDESFIALLDMIGGPGHTPSESVARMEMVDAVRGAVAALPRDRRQAVQLVYIEGHSLAAVARMMGRTKEAVHNLCYKAKRQLRGLLGGRSRFMGAGD